MAVVTPAKYHHRHSGDCDYGSLRFTKRGVTQSVALLPSTRTPHRDDDRQSWEINDSDGERWAVFADGRVYGIFSLWLKAA